MELISVRPTLCFRTVLFKQHNMKYLVIALCTIFLTSELLFAHPVEDQVQHPSVENVRPQRHTSSHDGQDDDAVDFGAHTGDNGAFGWYAHYPV